MRVGFAGYSWPGTHGQPAEVTLEQVAAHGLEVMQFLEPAFLSQTLDPGRLSEIRRAGDAIGVDVELGISELMFTGNDCTETTRHRIDACLAAGFTEISAFTKLDRFDPREPMRSQLDRLTRALGALTDALTGHGAHLNLETHEDLTSDEVAGVLQRLDPEAIGVTLDVANLAVHAEDPVAATRRVAPWVRQTHLADVRLHLVPRGVRRITRPVGEGAIDWAAIVGALADLPRPPSLCLEIHRGQYDADVFDPRWIACHPDLRVAELAGHLADAVAGAQSRGEVVDHGDWPVPLGRAPHAERIAGILAGAASLRATRAAACRPR